MSEKLFVDVVVTGEQPVVIDGIERTKGNAVKAEDCVSLRFLMAIGAVMAGTPAAPPAPEAKKKPADEKKKEG